MDRPCGDEVDAHPALAEVASKVAPDALERCLGYPHPVIHRPRDAGVEVEADDGAARPLGRFQERQHAAHERLERERTGLEGRRRACDGGAQEGATEGIFRCKGNRVQHAVEAMPTRRQLASDCLKVMLGVDVQLQHVGWHGKLLGRSLRQAPRAPEPGQDDLGARELGQACDLEGDRVPCEHPGDEQTLAAQHGTTPCG